MTKPVPHDQVEALSENMSTEGEKTRVVVCGEKLVAEKCLEFLHERDDTTIVAIVAAPRDWQADLIAWGTSRRLKVFVGNLSSYIDELTSLEPDFLFSIQYRPLIREPVLSLPRMGCVNLHFGLLPRYGGCYPIAWAILNGEKEAGATLHYMNERFDEGDIIDQSSVRLTSQTTARELFDCISDEASGLFRRTYPLLRSGEVRCSKQDLSNKLYYGKDSINFRRDSVIDWTKPGIQVQRRICAFSFEPFQLPATTLRSGDGGLTQVTLGATRLLTGQTFTGAHQAGQLVKLDGGQLAAVAGDGELIGIGLLDGKSPADYLASQGLCPSETRFVTGDIQ